MIKPIFSKAYLVLIIAGGCFSSAAAQQISSFSPVKPVAVDGRPDEWPQPFRYYDGATKLQFAFANDTANLYICVKVTDEATQMRLLRAGMGLWIDTKGKKKETTGISFPIKQEHSGNGEWRKRNEEGGEGNTQPTEPMQQRDMLNRMKEHALLQQTTLRIKGFTGVADQDLPLKNDYGINTSFNWDTLNTLCIEYKVPLALILGHALTAADAAKPVSIGFVENALEMPNRNMPDAGEMGGPGGGGGMEGGMGGGGMGSGYGNGGMGGGGYGNNGMGGGYGGGGMGGPGGGGGMGGMHPDFSSLQTDQHVWNKVLLVYAGR
ncbi:MAG TPA: hypothetical protein VG603_04750 [Chitinophagales bacterium]|nr:hypothetical protein [Chitinophagales bacterium]